MSGDRALAIVIAVLAGLGLPIAGVALLFSPMLFDAPDAGGWPVTLLWAGLLAGLPCLLAASIVGIAAATARAERVRRKLLLAALVALLTPAALIGSGALAVRLVCDGTFTCRKVPA